MQHLHQYNAEIHRIIASDPFYMYVTLVKTPRHEIRRSVRYYQAKHIFCHANRWVNLSAQIYSHNSLSRYVNSPHMFPPFLSAPRVWVLCVVSSYRATQPQLPPQARHYEESAVKCIKYFK